MKTKKIPLRMCTGCMEMKPKKELVRIVKNKEGEVSIDLTGKKPGRGAYICKDIQCLEKAFRTKKLEKNLEIKISDELYERLKEEL
ncbi:RNase P modulator RnpM [Clostridium oryzae]|uniref:YlxR domain-containing protein n=1 Tax=Clostridium oryzae TaxID=1450648 RepID=A0A1V4IPK0_9CLOT|nr:YlxR family protein [Clostridium oryzae]OPJ61809.1 hypothetical protein CLORY_21150 [Clostridium oryzae]